MNVPRPELAHAMVERTLGLLDSQPPGAVEGDVIYVSSKGKRVVRRT